jgi:hypothetical protein
METQHARKDQTRGYIYIYIYMYVSMYICKYAIREAGDDRGLFEHVSMRQQVCPQKRASIKRQKPEGCERPVKSQRRCANVKRLARCGAQLAKKLGCVEGKNFGTGGGGGVRERESVGERERERKRETEK